MGVYHMAIPFSSPFSDRLRGNPGIPAQPRLQPIKREPTPQPAAPGTLSHQARVAEVRVQRTPEQQAEQDALAHLVARCLGGEQRAWQELVSGQHRRVYGLCYRFTGDATEAEDVTQDVFLKVYRNLGSFDTGKGSFQTWITTLTRNMLVDTYRRGRLDRASDSLDVAIAGDEDGPTMAERLADPRPGQTQERHVAGLELRASIQHALKQISPDLREAVILRDLEDMDYKEIALILKIPEGTVKSRISRGRAELAKLLANLEGQV